MITGKKIKTPKEMDSFDLRFFKQGREIGGFGYIGKHTKTIGLIRCPKCGQENYAGMVSRGACAFCGFDAKKIEIK